MSDRDDRRGPLILSAEPLMGCGSTAYRGRVLSRVIISPEVHRKAKNQELSGLCMTKQMIYSPTRLLWVDLITEASAITPPRKRCSRKQFNDLL